MFPKFLDARWVSVVTSYSDFKQIMLHFEALGTFFFLLGQFLVVIINQ